MQTLNVILLLACLMGIGFLGIRGAMDKKQIIKRLKHLETSAAKIPNPPSTAGAIASGPLLENPGAAFSSEDAKPVQLFYCTTDGKPALAISKLPRQKFSKYIRLPLDLTASRLASLRQVILAAPGILTHARIKNGSYMEVLVNAPLVATRVPGPLMPMVRGANGEFIEFAGAKDAANLAQLTSATAIWSTASAIMTEKFLHDICQKLEALKNGIAEINEFIVPRHEAFIRRTLSFLQEQAYPNVVDGEFSAEIRAELESMDNGLIDMQNGLLTERGQRQEKVEDPKNPNDLCTSETLQALSAQVQKEVDIRKQYALALRTRVACWQILSTFPQTGIVKKNKKLSIVDATCCDISTSTPPMLSSIFEKFDLADANANAANNNFLTNQAAIARQVATQAMEESAEDIFKVREEVENIFARLQAVQKPIRIAVKLEDGKMAKAFELVDQRAGLLEPA